MDKLSDLRVDIQNSLDANKIAEAKVTFSNFIVNLENESQTDTKELANLYAEYAILLFELGDFDEFLLLMDIALDKGYSSEIYEQILLEAFIEPNIQDLKKNYIENRNCLVNGNYINREIFVDWEELDYVVPNGVQGECYLISKDSKRIVRKIDSKQNLKEGYADFSNVLYVGNTIFEVADLQLLQKQKVYILSENTKEFLSVLQIGQIDQNVLGKIERIFINTDEVKQFFVDGVNWLPRKMIGESNSQTVVEVCCILNKVRTLRKTSNREYKPLLTIGIPTYNRGKRALETIRQILAFPLDFEIEIVVSNNGTKNQTFFYYNEIQNINDNRIRYYQFDENQGVSLNICQVAEMARGDFLLFLSDEDSINLPVLYKMMTDLVEDRENIGMYKPASTQHYKNVFIDVRKSRGMDALDEFAYKSNYLSGNTFNVTLLKEINAIDYVKNNQENEIAFLYPHMCFELFVAQFGDVISSTEILIIEGVAEDTTIVAKEQKIKTQKDINIPQYAFFEERLKQHISFYEILVNLELCQQNIYLLRRLYTKLVEKTFYLVSIAIELHYKQNNYDIAELLEKCYLFCKKDVFLVSDEEMREVDLQTIQGIYKEYLVEFGLLTKT